MLNPYIGIIWSRATPATACAYMYGCNTHKLALCSHRPTGDIIISSTPGETRAGKLTGLMLLLHHPQKDVSSSTGGAEGVSYLAPSSGSNQVQQQMLFYIPSPVCFDTALGNRLDLNICMGLDVPAESSDSVLSTQNTLSRFKKHGCQCNS